MRVASRVSWLADGSLGSFSAGSQSIPERPGAVIEREARMGFQLPDQLPNFLVQPLADH